jgi:cell wall-associated NlpC family hydrolase
MSREAPVGTTLRFVLLGDDRAGSAFNRFADQVDKSNKSVAASQAALNRNETAMRQLSAQTDKASASVGRSSASFRQQSKDAGSANKSVFALVGTVTGFDAVTQIASKDSSIFAKALGAVNLATGVAEPALAGLLVTAGGLAAAFASGGAGLAAYSVALKPLITETSAVTTAQKALDSARVTGQLAYKAALAGGASQQTAAASRTTAMAAAQAKYNAAVKDTPAPVIAFAKTLKATQDSYQKWANGLARPVLAPLQKGLTLVNPLLHDITPLVLAGAKAIGILIGQASRSLSGGGLTKFVQELVPHVIPAILFLGHSIANIAVGIGGIIRAFLPMADTVGAGTEKLTAKFRQWATSLPSHSGFQSLMTTFKTETPLAVQVLKNLVVIIKNVAAATVGLASPANSKALLQILVPLTQIMAQLTANAGLVRAVIYFGLLRGTLARLKLAFLGVKTGLTVFSSGTAITGATKLYGVIGRLVGGYRNAAVAASAFSGAAGTAGGKLASFVARGGTAASVLVSLLGPLGVAAAAIGVLAVATNGFKATEDRLGESIDRQVKAAGFSSDAYARLAKQTNVAEGSNSRLAQSFRSAQGGMADSGLAAKAYQLRMGVLAQVHAQVASAAANLSTRLHTLQDVYGLSAGAAQKLAQKAGVTGQQLAASGQAGQAAFRKIVSYATGSGQATVASLRLTDAQNALKRSLDRVTNGLLTGQQSLLSFQQAQKTALTAINNSNTGLRGQSSAAMDARQQVLLATQAAIDLANGESRQKNGMAKATGTIQDQIKWLKVHAGHSKFAAAEVDALREALRLLKNKAVDITVAASGHWSVSELSHGGQLLNGGGGRRIKNSATGGAVRGPGGPTEDKAGLYALSNNEWVIRANSAAHYGDRAMHAVNTGQAAILYPGMAAGGQVAGTFKGTPRGVGSFETSQYNQTVTTIEQATAKATAAGIKSAQLKANAGSFGIGKGGNRGLARYAASFGTGLNHPYVWGGNTPAGWDCSGFSKWCYNHYGYSPPRTSQTQQLWAKPSGDIPGALVFFYGGGGTASHVGISLGGGRYVGADNPGVGTVIHSSGGNSGFGVPPGGFAKGGKVGKHDPYRKKWLAQLATAVHTLRTDEKHAAIRRRKLRTSVDVTELWFLNHPKAKKGTIGYNEHHRDRMVARANLARFNITEGRTESALSRKIAILRRLAGYPSGAKYGGPGKPAPDPGDPGGDGGGDTGGGSSGGGGGSAPGPTFPAPAWLLPYIGGGQPGAAGGIPAGLAGLFGRPRMPVGMPFLDPVGRFGPRSGWSGDGGASPSGGGGWAELADAMHQMRREVTAAVRGVAPGTSRGLDDVLNKNIATVAGRFM